MPVRDTPQSRQERRRQQRRQQIARQQRRQSTRRWYIIGGVLLLLLLGGGGAGGYFAFNHSPRAAGQPRATIDGISCQSEMRNSPIHAHPTLYKSAHAVPVPPFVGIPYSSAIGGQNTCLYFLHTHDANGVIHVESPTTPKRPYALGQFFDIWHYPSL